MTVVRVRGQGALGRTISFAADPQPTFAAEFCCVLSREGVRKKLCNSDQAHFTPKADMADARSNVRFVPKADSCTAE